MDSVASSHPRRRRATAMVLVAAVVASLLHGLVAGTAGAGVVESSLTTSPGPWGLERLSVAPDGSPADGDSDDPTISADGSAVAFTTQSSNLIPSHSPTVVVRSLADGSLTDVAVAGAGQPLQSPREPDLDADGSHVVMSHTSGGERALALRDRVAGTTTNVGPGIGLASPAVSAAGDRTVFVQVDTTLGDSDERDTVWLRDDRPLGPGEDVEVNLSAFVGEKDEALSPAISGDGNTVAYQARIGGTWGVRVHDVAARPFADPEWYPGRSAPTLSADGRYLVTTGRDDASGQQAVLRLDRLTGDDIVVAALPGNGFETAVSSDGSIVAYAVTYRDDADENRTEIRVTNVSTGRTEAVATVDPSPELDLSGDGRTIAFSTDQPDLVPGDTGRERDVFVARRTDSTAPTWPLGAALVAEQTNARSVLLRWAAAEDDSGVAGYLLTRDGEVVGDLPASATSFRATGLEPESFYSFAVVAVDNDGNTSGALSRAVMTAPESTEPGTAALAATAGPGGSVLLQWDAPVEPADAVRVLRAEGDGELVPMGEDLPGDAVEHVDGGLTAETTYRYAVDVVRGGQAVRHTVEVAATTPPVSIDQTTWAGRGRLGTDIAITLLGAPGWIGGAEVEHRSWFGEDGSELDQPRTVTTVVPASEDPATPGTYRATFRLVDGTAEVTKVSGVLSDGAGHERRATPSRAPLKVSGALTVTVDAPADSLGNSRLAVTDVGQVAVSGGGTTEFPGVSAGQHGVSVLSPRGRVLGETTVTIRDGLRSSVAVTPEIPAEAAVRVLGEDGRPVQGASVTYSTTGGKVLGAGLSDSTGVAAAGVEASLGDHLSVGVQPPGRLPLHSTTREIEVRTEVTDVVLEPFAAGQVTGTVTIEGSRPAVGARVVLDQQVGGRSWSFAAETDDQGRYTLNGLGASGTVTASFRADEPVTAGPVDLSTGGAVQDIVLPQPSKYELQLDLYTRSANDSGWQGPIDLDWSSAVHLYASVRTSGGVQKMNSEKAVIDGRAGDVIEVCADGQQAGMDRACQEVTLGSTRHVSAELRLSSVASVSGRVVTPAGQPIPPTGNPTVSVSRILDDGSLEWIFGYPIHEARFDVNVASAGRYRFSVMGDGRARSIDLDISDGDEIDLGDLVVTRSTWVDRSQLTASRRTVPTGGTTDVRALIHPGRAGVQTGVAARLNLPAGVALVPGSLTLDGVPVEGTLDGGVLTVALPDRDFTSPNDDAEAWVLRYRLRVTSAEGGDDLIATLGVRHSGDSFGSAIAAVTLQVAGVTVEAPDRSVSRTVNLSGWGPAGSTVEVRDGNDVVGHATVRSGGLWSLNVELPDLGNGTTHLLSASAEVDGEMLTSPARGIVVDERIPELTSVTLSRPGADGRPATSVTFDPRNGVARFPFVHVGSLLEVDARFSGRGAVEGVQARVGARSAPAAQMTDDTWKSRLSSSTASLGTLGLDYTAVPQPSTLESEAKPTLDQVRRRLPDALADVGEPTIQEAPPTSATATFPAPGLGPDAQVTTTLSVERGLTYTPTAADLAAAKSTGVQMYGTTFDWERNGDTLTVTMSGYVPESLLGGAPVRAGVAIGAARPIFQHVFTGAQTLDSLATATGGLVDGDKYSKLNHLLNYVTANCDPFHASMHRDALMNMSERALANDATHAALMLAGTVLAPSTFGIGTLAVWGVTFFLDKQADYLMDDAIGNLANQIQADCPREDSEDQSDPSNPPDPDDPEVADPVWIHDPSGYVFEAVPSNRVQGVTATLLHGETPDGPFVPWDAEWYGQSNPLTTTAEGAYGWDVPEGFWQVLYTKDGYETGRSRVLEVLPPHFDVNVGLVSRTAPEVESVTGSSGDGGGVEVAFSRYMQLSVADDPRITVTDADGRPVEGTVTPVDAEDGPAGRFARTFRFSPATPFADGSELGVEVLESATSYAGIPLAGPFSTTVTATPPPPAAPRAVDDRATVDEDGSTVIAVLGNDTGGSATLAVTGLTRPAHGAATLAADGTVTYVPEPDWYGTDTFTYAATDGRDTSGAATVAVEVTPVADAPVARDVEVAGDEDTLAVVDPAGAAADADGDRLTVTALGDAGHGTVTLRDDGRVDYHPDEHWNGTDSFTFRVTDGELTSQVATATLRVHPVNDAPASADDTATTSADTAVAVAVLANDEDADGDTLSVEVADAPTHGTATVGADQRVTYTPSAGWSGTDRFTYRAIDPAGERSATTTVTVTVAPRPDDPTCTITGTARRDVLRGTAGHDVICGLGGDDVLVGNGGDDLLLGGAGNDRLDGGTGDDTLDGGDGVDSLLAGAGRDTLAGGAGLDVLSGGSGDDRLDGGAEWDLIDGGAGRDGWRRGDVALAVWVEYRY